MHKVTIRKQGARVVGIDLDGRAIEVTEVSPEWSPGNVATLTIKMYADIETVEEPPPEPDEAYDYHDGPIDHTD